MESLKKLLTTKNIIVIAAVGTAAYFILKKRNEAKGLAIVEVTSKEQLAPTDSLDQVISDCEASSVHMKMSVEAKKQHIAMCIADKTTTKKR